MASIQPSKRRWLRARSWAFVLGEQPEYPLIVMRREYGRKLFWRIWRWFPGGFGS